MPIYEYEHSAKRGKNCQVRFEILQKMSDAPLEKCPECGHPCYRVMSAVSTIRNEKAILAPKNLERLGFTQFKKAGDGRYEKTCGDGPQLIKRD